MKKIINVKKLTNEKYLNLYKITYEENGKTFDYIVSSRRDKNNLEYKVPKVDAVKTLPYVIKNNKIYVVVTNEYRHTIGKKIYGTPAGLVDFGEDTTLSVIRELEEEIGAEVIKIRKVQSSGYSSAGLTDETLECFYAQVELKYNQNLSDHEDINFELVELGALPKFLKTHQFDLPSALLIKAFYYEMKLKEKSL